MTRQEKARARAKRNMKTLREARRDAGLCAQCGLEEAKAGTRCEGCRDRHKSWREANPERIATHGKTNRDRHRSAVLDHYGRVCACCGEDAEVVLTIDHIEGGGNEHRREISNNLYRWLVAQDFPDGFQTLCHNCNFAKYRLGECYHQTLESLEEALEVAAKS